MNFKKYIQNKWDEYYWKFVMKYENKLSWITVEMIEKHLDNPWDSDFISRNPNITMEIIEKYPDKPWDWNHM
jgi:hypothetical protein